MNIFNWFKSNKSSHEDKYLGILTWDTSSPRVKLIKHTDGLDISIKWISDEQFVTRINRPQNIAHITYPIISQNDSATVPLQVDPTAFFTQKELSNPYQETSNVTKNMLVTEDNRREKLPEIWKQLLLVHPSSTIVTHLLKTQVSLESFEVSATMAGLMVCAIDEIRREVAKVIWHREYDPEYFFTVLGNHGVIPSGILYEEGKRAALIMREYCPDSKKEWFRKKALDLFGPSVAGIKAKTTESKVRFKTKYTKPIGATTIGTYEVYTASSKADARSFLENYKITKQHFYVEVETPEGPLGKDIMGIY